MFKLQSTCKKKHNCKPLAKKLQTTNNMTIWLLLSVFLCLSICIVFWKNYFFLFSSISSCILRLTTFFGDWTPSLLFLSNKEPCCTCELLFLTIVSFMLTWSWWLNPCSTFSLQQGALSYSKAFVSENCSLHVDLISVAESVHYLLSSTMSLVLLASFCFWQLFPWR